MTKDKYIFEPMAALDDLIARNEAARNDPNDKLAEFYMSADDMRGWCATVHKKLEQMKALSAEEAALRMGVTPDEVDAMARCGEVIAYVFEGRMLVPDYQFTKSGAVDPMVLDFAREYAREVQSGEPVFLTFSDFMTKWKIDVSACVKDTVQPLLDDAEAGLRARFGEACRVEARVRLPVVALIRGRADYPVFRDVAVGALLKDVLPPGNAMAGPAEVFLSDGFKKKYGLDEQGIWRAYSLLPG